LIMAAALVLGFATPVAAQGLDSLSRADRASVVAQVLQARRAELRDEIAADTAALARVLHASPGAVPVVAALLASGCDPVEPGRWIVQELDGGENGDVLVRAERIDSSGSARSETYRLRHACAEGPTCTWWLVEIRLGEFESNDIVPLPGSPGM
jgi:hypothetical protein